MGASHEGGLVIMPGFHSPSQSSGEVNVGVSSGVGQTQCWHEHKYLRKQYIFEYLLIHKINSLKGKDSILHFSAL